MPKLPADHAAAGADDGAATTDQDKVEKDKVDTEPAEKGLAQSIVLGSIGARAR